MEFQPGQIGYDMEYDASMTIEQGRRNTSRLVRRRALKCLDHALAHGEDLFEPIDSMAPEVELNGSGVSIGSAYTKYEFPDIRPEEQVQHEYHGDAPQDP